MHKLSTENIYQLIEQEDEIKDECDLEIDYLGIMVNKLE